MKRTHVPCRRCGRYDCACTQGPSIYANMVIMALLLLAAPLSAQQTVVVPDVNVEVQVEPTPIEITVDVPARDSAAIARDEAGQRAMESIAEYFENCGCINQGPSTVVRVGQGALVLAAFFIGWQLKRIADNETVDIHNEGDTNVEVNVPPHEHDEPVSDDDHDSSEGN